MFQADINPIQSNPIQSSITILTMPPTKKRGWTCSSTIDHTCTRKLPDQPSEAKGEFNDPFRMRCSPECSCSWLILPFIGCKDLMPVVNSSPLLKVKARIIVLINFLIHTIFAIFIIISHSLPHLLHLFSWWLIGTTIVCPFGVVDDGYQRVTNIKMNGNPHGVCADLNGGAYGARINVWAVKHQQTIQFRYNISTRYDN